MENVLEIDSVRLSFGDNDVLMDVCLNCRPGDVVGLFGRNGTGKSTLLKMIFGTLKKGITYNLFANEITVYNKFLRINGQFIKGAGYRSGLLSYLPQHNFLPPTLSVRNITKLYLPPEQINEFLGDPFLFKTRDQKARDLSGGEQRYLEIKLLLYSPAPYILLDEPFSGISPVAAEAVREHIRIISPHKGIIMTDHNFREVHKIANRIYLIHDGYLRPIENEKDLIPYGYYVEE